MYNIVIKNGNGKRWDSMNNDMTEQELKKDAVVLQDIDLKSWVYQN